MLCSEAYRKIIIRTQVLKKNFPHFSLKKATNLVNNGLIVYEVSAKTKAQMKVIIVLLPLWFNNFKNRM
jgi:hypothetical protein